MKLFCLSALLAGSLLLASCASAISGTQKSIRVTSSPSGALVRLDGTTRGITPAVVHPSTRSDHMLAVDLAGYQHMTIPLRRQHSWLLLGNVATGVIPGTVFDMATGAVYTFTPHRIHLDLIPLGSRPAQ
jgi:PEGA domain